MKKRRKKIMKKNKIKKIKKIRNTKIKREREREGGGMREKDWDNLVILQGNNVKDCVGGWEDNPSKDKRESYIDGKEKVELVMREKE